MPRPQVPDKPPMHWTTRIGQAAGHPAAFAVVVI
jgi:hypothetical protein